MTGSWGATETAPAVTSANFPFTDARCIGAPLPGALVKLAPAEDAYEIRVQGPNVTPGYYGRPDLTAEAFDAEGFYRTGDSVAFADPGDPNAGLVFRGRIAEDFKLSTGTFVRVGAVRTALLSAVPALSDAVIAGRTGTTPPPSPGSTRPRPASCSAVTRRRPTATWSPTRTCCGCSPTRSPGTTRATARRPAIERLLVLARPAEPGRRARSPTRATSTSAGSWPSAPPWSTCCTLTRLAGRDRPG